MTIDEVLVKKLPNRIKYKLYCISSLHFRYITNFDNDLYAYICHVLNVIFVERKKFYSKPEMKYKRKSNARERQRRGKSKEDMLLRSK